MISLFVTWWVSYESDLSLHGSIVLAPSFQSMSPVLLCSCGWCPFISRNYFTVDHIRRGSRSREGTDNKQYLLLQLSLRYDTVQYSKVQYSTVECNAVQCNLYNTERNATQHNAMHNASQCNAIQCDTIH